MKAEAMKLVADGLVSAIRRHVHETREQVEARVAAGETVVNDLRRRLDAAEAGIAELKQKLQLRRIA